MVQIIGDESRYRHAPTAEACWSRRVSRVCVRAGAVVLPAIALGAAPWIVRNSQAAEIPVNQRLDPPPVVLGGHVFAHGCTPVAVTLDGQPIRVDRAGNFAVAVRSPKQKITATFEFSAPGCRSSSRKVVLRPGITRYGIAASVFPHFAERSSGQPVAGARRAAFTLADSTRRRLPPQVRSVAGLVERYAEEAGLDPALVFAVVHTESNFDVDAHSKANAVGLMQLIPHLGASDAARYLVKTSGSPDQGITVNRMTLRDPATNLRLGTVYLKMLMQSYDDDVSNNRVRRRLALAAYNWGPGNLQSAITSAGRMPRTTADVTSLLHHYAPKETQRYVRKVTQRMAWYEQVL